jgi:hypothetical protein
VLAGPTAVIVAAKTMLGAEIDADEIMRAIPGDVRDVLVNERDLHGRTLQDIAARVGDAARGVFLQALMRRGQEVPLTSETRV